MFVPGSRRVEAIIFFPPPNPYVCFPTCSATDDKFLVATGDDPTTLHNDSVLIEIASPPSSTQFTFGVFDGNPTGNWDLISGHAPTAVPELQFDLYSDPNQTKDQSNLLASCQAPNLAACGFVSAIDATTTLPVTAMVDDHWVDLTINDAASAQLCSPTCGPHHYLLVVSAVDPVNHFGANAFKIRTTGTTFLHPQEFGILGNASSLAQAAGYDGRWTFNFDVPPGTANVAIWDGDFDFGDTACLHNDTDDPDSPDFPPFGHVGATAEGVAFNFGGTHCPTGSPADDNNGQPNARRIPSAFPGGFNVVYELVDSLLNEYLNLNPSGNEEWEQFKIVADATAPAPVNGIVPCLADADPLRSAEDCKGIPDPGQAGGPFLASGLYAVNIDGLDLKNASFFHFNFPSFTVCPDCFYHVHGIVWNDLNANQTFSNSPADDPETGYQNVTVSLYDNSNNLLQTKLTDASGIYDFQVTVGTYVVVIGVGNFASGKPLFHEHLTTPSNALTRSVDDNNKTAEADFGYRNLAPVAVNDAYTTTPGGTLPVAATGILTNDSDPEGDPLSVNSQSLPITTSYGKVTALGANGSFSYMNTALPPTGTCGAFFTVNDRCDTFTYQDSDGLANSNVATVYIKIASTIDAIDDSGATINGAVGGQSYPNVLVDAVNGNDTLNGANATLGVGNQVDLSLVSSTNAGVTLNTGNGSVNVTAGTPFGNYSLVYKICDHASERRSVTRRP